MRGSKTPHRCLC